jgi:two-component system phosphate regulon sensor histidine kinase PhoR
VKFNQAGGWANIAAYGERDSLIIEVSDNGLGMPPGIEAMITDIFSQCDMSLARRHGGVGLGLTFVHRVAHYHDAALKISSKLGEGTKVTLIFPARRVVRALVVA